MTPGVCSAEGHSNIESQRAQVYMVHPVRQDRRRGIIDASQEYLRTVIICV